MTYSNDTPSLSSGELDRVFGAGTHAKILVIGDFCLDHYLFLDERLSEISVETGIPTRAVRAHRAEPGGAGNVVANLCSLGAQNVTALGIVGDDLYGRELVRQLRSLGADTDHMILQTENWSTGVFAKPYIDDREEARIDFGNANALSESSERNLIRKIETLLPQSDMVLINQQAMGTIHTTAVRKALKDSISAHPNTPVLVDSRSFAESFAGAMQKMTCAEAARALGPSSDGPQESLELASSLAGELFHKWRRSIFLTVGARGAVVCDETGLHSVPAIQITERVDTVGAGDSVLAGLAVALAAGMSAERAQLFANHVAAVTVTKQFRAGTATEVEVRTVAANAFFRYSVAVAEDPRRAEYVGQTEIENVYIKTAKTLEYALFDHDGTISTLREGWEAVMEPVMVRAILGNHIHTVSADVYDRVVHESRAFISRTTGIQTLTQMFGLKRMVEQFGFTSPKEVKDPLGYKRDYLAELEQIVSKRVARLESGELDAGDFTIKGAIAALQKLRERGVVLFLASGTDDDALRREAELLGYASLFDGGIYGAVDDIDHDPKRVVVDRILDLVGDGNARRLVTFGDGPIEMQETRKRGGVCIGVASNETRRFGLNTDKRRRLILAGAHAVIPDFSQFPQLLEALESDGSR